MNILAEQQLKMFEAGISEEERSKRVELFNQLYFELRHKEENSYLWAFVFKSTKKASSIRVVNLHNEKSP